MKKYNIENCDKFDFNAELLKSLEESDDELDKVCMITQEPLKEDYVKLSCGHAFNYVPLYNDLCNYKKKFMCMDYNNKLNYDQIRCPYCRCKINGLLKYIDIPGVKEVHGINFIDEDLITPNLNKNYSSKDSKKCYVNGNYEMFTYMGTDKKCEYKQPVNSVTNISLSGCNQVILKKYDKDGHHYCYKHYCQVMRKDIKEAVAKKLAEEKMKKQEAKLKEKEEKAAAKLKEKEEKAAAKLKEKEEKIAAKLKAKEEKMVADLSGNVLEVGCCKEIIKSGVKKGQFCGIKIFGDDMCKRHYNSKNKNIVECNKDK